MPFGVNVSHADSAESVSKSSDGSGGSSPAGAIAAVVVVVFVLAAGVGVGGFFFVRSRGTRTAAPELNNNPLATAAVANAAYSNADSSDA